MIPALVISWCLVGAISVPWLIGWMNRHGDTMIREPASEAMIGIFFGPIPLLMFGLYFLFKMIGLVVYRLTGQTEETS